MAIKIELVIIFLTCLLCGNRVNGIMYSLGSDTGGIEACPGQNIAITCSHNVTLLTRWEVEGMACVATHDTPGDLDCNGFTITNVTGAVNNLVMSTASASASEMLDNFDVSCRAGGLSTSPLVGDVSITILPIPTATIQSVEQVSQSTLRVNLMEVTDLCLGDYRVDAAIVGSPAAPSTSTSPTPVVELSDLDICASIYNLMPSIVTPGGVRGDILQNFFFNTNFSVVDGVIRDDITVRDALIALEWVQRANPLYPTCIQSYTLADENDNSRNITFPTSIRSVTSNELNQAGFPYCTRSTVTFRTLVQRGDVISEVTGIEVVPRDPAFQSPVLSGLFSLDNDTTMLRITIQDISDAVVPIRQYQYGNASSGEMSGFVSFTGNYFEIELPGASYGQIIPVTVLFRNNLCQDSSSANFTVPPRVISNLMQDQPTETMHTITITLPLTEFPPEQLSIVTNLNSLTAPDREFVVPFTQPGDVVTLSYTGLVPDTPYNFSIRVLVNNTANAVPAIAGSFDTAPTVPPTTMSPSTPAPTMAVACDSGCIAGIVVAIVAVLIIVIIIIVIIVVVLMLKKCNWHSYNVRGSDSESGTTHGHEMNKVEPSPKVEIVPDNEVDPSPKVVELVAENSLYEPSPKVEIIPQAEIDQIESIVAAADNQ